jgi:hypothetical protein
MEGEIKRRVLAKLEEIKQKLWKQLKYH